LSCSTSLHSAQWMVAATEFCSSAIWVACSLILSNHYSKKPLLFARGVTYLSLASTGGQLFAKTVGSALLQFTDWRRLAQIGGLVGVLGSLVMRFVVAQQMYMEEPKHHLFGRSVSSSSASLSGVMVKVKDVLSNRLLGMVGLAHVSGYSARTCDRMMGPFLKDVTALPRTCIHRMVEPRRLPYICNGQTLTLVFIPFFLIIYRSIVWRTDSIRNSWLCLWSDEGLVLLRSWKCPTKESALDSLVHTSGDLSPWLGPLW
jgi:hypothetical protein